VVQAETAPTSNWRRCRAAVAWAGVTLLLGLMAGGGLAAGTHAPASQAVTSVGGAAEIFIHNWPIFLLLVGGGATCGMLTAAVLLCDGVWIGYAVVAALQLHSAAWVADRVLPHAGFEVAAVMCGGAAGYLPAVNFVRWLRGRDAGSCSVADSPHRPGSGRGRVSESALVEEPARGPSDMIQLLLDIIVLSVMGTVLLGAAAIVEAYVSGRVG